MSLSTCTGKNMRVAVYYSECVLQCVAVCVALCVAMFFSMCCSVCDKLS